MDRVHTVVLSGARNLISRQNGHRSTAFVLSCDGRAWEVADEGCDAEVRKVDVENRACHVVHPELAQANQHDAAGAESDY